MTSTLKSEFIPKHTQQVGDNFVLWFEKLNSYVVISEIAFLLLDCYFDSKNKNTFFLKVQDKFDIPVTEAKSYYEELTEFLYDLNVETRSDKSQIAIHPIPNPVLSKDYVFGDAYIRINFASQKIQQLIHPYLQHALVNKASDPSTLFDIFESEGRLFLFKNKFAIGSYPTADFHFLQGKFAMELVASIYNNTESDWMATFHASTICNDEEAIMIIGDSGNGKSTLSALLMAHGFDLLADDFTPMLAENQQVYRFPAAISIKKGAFTMIESLYDDFHLEPLQVSSSKQTTVKYLPPSKPFGTAPKHFECHKLVMVKFDAESISDLQPCPPEKLLQTFIPDSWISPKAEHSKKFLNWLKDLKFYELIYSDNDFAVEKFHELFKL